MTTYLITNMQISAIKHLTAYELTQMLHSLPMVDSEPVAEFCGTNSEDLHIAELNGTWKFIKIGSKLYTSPQALTTITADDVTDEMVAAYHTTTSSSKEAILRIIKVWIKHRSEAK